MSEHKSQTDRTHQVELASSIERVQWARLRAAPGGTVGLDLFTRFVGNGAMLQIKITDHHGTTHGAYKNQIHNNHLSAEIQIPPEAREALYAEVKFPKHGLQQKSPALLLTPPVEVKNAKWSQSEARRGDLLTLSADVRGVPDGTEAQIQIFEHDADGAHDPITRFTTLVEKKCVEAEWEYEYYEDTDDIPSEKEVEKGYQPPEYFFRVEVEGVTADSELLTFKDELVIQVKDLAGRPIQSKKYVVHLADGARRKGMLDETGHVTEKDVPPGKIRLKLKDI